MADKFDISEHIKVQALGSRLVNIDSATQISANGKIYDSEDYVVVIAEDLDPDVVTPADQMTYNFVSRISGTTVYLYWEPVAGATAYRKVVNGNPTTIGLSTSTSVSDGSTSFSFAVDALRAGSWERIIGLGTVGSYYFEKTSMIDGWYAPNLSANDSRRWQDFPVTQTVGGTPIGDYYEGVNTIGPIGAYTNGSTRLRFSYNPTFAVSAEQFQSVTKYLIGVSGSGTAYPQYEIFSRALEYSDTGVVEFPYDIEIPTAWLDKTSTKITIAAIMSDNSYQLLEELTSPLALIGDYGDNSTVVELDRPLTIPSGDLAFEWEYHYLNQRNGNCTWTKDPRTDIEPTYFNLGQASLGYNIFAIGTQEPTTEYDEINSNTGSLVLVAGKDDTSGTVDTSFMGEPYTTFRIYPRKVINFTETYNEYPVELEEVPRGGYIPIPTQTNVPPAYPDTPTPAYTFEIDTQLTVDILNATVEATVTIQNVPANSFKDLYYRTRLTSGATTDWVRLVHNPADYLQDTVITFTPSSSLLPTLMDTSKYVIEYRTNDMRHSSNVELRAIYEWTSPDVFESEVEIEFDEDRHGFTAIVTIDEFPPAPGDNTTPADEFWGQAWVRTVKEVPGSAPEYGDWIRPGPNDSHDWTPGTYKIKIFDSQQGIDGWSTSPDYDPEALLAFYTQPSLYEIGEGEYYWFEVRMFDGRDDTPADDSFLTVIRKLVLDYRTIGEATYETAPVESDDSSGLARKMVQTYQEDVTLGFIDNGDNTYEYNRVVDANDADKIYYLAHTGSSSFPRYKYRTLSGNGVMRFTIDGLPSDDYLAKLFVADGTELASVTVGDPYKFSYVDVGYAYGWWPVECAVSSLDITTSVDIEKGLLKRPEPGTCSLVMKGLDGDPRGNGALSIDNKIRVQLDAAASPSGATEALFYGFIESVSTTYDTFGNIITNLNAIDALSRVMNVNIPLYEYANDESFSRRMYNLFNDYIGPATSGVSYDDTIWQILEPSDGSRFPPEDRVDVSASEIITELTEGEYATMAQSRGGVIFWWNRAIPAALINASTATQEPSHYGFSTVHTENSLDHFCISDFTVKNSIEDITNKVVAKLSYDDPTEHVYTDPTSITKYGERAFEVELNLDAPDGDPSLYLRKWTEEVPYSEDRPELESITTSVVNRKGLVTNAFLYDINLDLMRVFIQVGTVDVNGVFFAQRIRHSITPNNWTMEIDLTAD